MMQNQNKYKKGNSYLQFFVFLVTNDVSCFPDQGHEILNKGMTVIECLNYRNIYIIGPVIASIGVFRFSFHFNNRGTPAESFGLLSY